MKSSFRICTRRPGPWCPGTARQAGASSWSAPRGHEVADPIAALLGADTVIATQMVITDGRYTGDFAFYAYGEAKAVRIRQLAAVRGYAG